MVKRIIMLSVLTCALGYVNFAAAQQFSYVASIQEPLTAPTSLSVDDDQIAVLEPIAGRVLVFSPNGVLANELDIHDDAIGLARLDASRYLVCEPKRGRVVAIDAWTGIVQGLVTGLQTPLAVLSRDTGYAVLDAGTHELVEFELNGVITRRIKLPSLDDGSVGAFVSMAWDSAADAYHVIDQHLARAMVIDRGGRKIREYCSFGAGDGTVSRVGGVACDADGFSYVSDRYQGRIAVFDSNGDFVTNLIPTAGTRPPLSIASGLVVDADGFVYVASTETRSIEVFHFDKSELLRGSMVAYPRYPLESAVASSLNLRLRIHVRAALSAGDPLLLDIEVSELPDAGAPVASVNDLVLSDLALDDGNIRSGEVAWMLPTPLEADSDYRWRTRVRTLGLVGEWSPPVSFRTLPVRTPFSLEQNQPNPFNPRTKIGFSVAHETDATLVIFDVRGQRVWQKDYRGLSAGRHELTWAGVDIKGDSVASGVYFYRFIAAGFDQTRKLVVVR